MRALDPSTAALVPLLITEDASMLHTTHRLVLFVYQDKQRSFKTITSCDIFFFLSTTMFLLVFYRLCRLWRRDQAGSVPPGTGETVARQLLQVSDVQHGPHGRVHQQVSAHNQREKKYVFLAREKVQVHSIISMSLLWSLQNSTVSLYVLQGWSAILRGGLPRPVWGKV